MVNVRGQTQLPPAFEFGFLGEHLANLVFLILYLGVQGIDASLPLVQRSHVEAQEQEPRATKNDDQGNNEGQDPFARIHACLPPKDGPTPKSPPCLRRLPPRLLPHSPPPSPT